MQTAARRVVVLTGAAGRCTTARSSSMAGLRSLTTAAPTHADLASHSGGSSSTSSGSSSATATTRKVAPVSLTNVEAQWTKLSEEEQAAVHEQLEVLQLRDWKELSLDEKKAAYYVAFGPHGPRAPNSNPGDNMKIFLSVGALVAAAGLLTVGLRQFSQPLPKTVSKEWEEAANERALEMKLNPISGISSEGYSGKGFVQTK